MTNARPIAFNTIACVALCFAGPLFSARTACAADDAVSAAKAAVGRYAGPQTVWIGTKLRTGARQGQAHCLPLWRRAERHLARVRAVG